MNTSPKLPRWAQLTSMVIVYATLIGYVIFHVAHHARAEHLPARPCPTPGIEHTTTINNGVFSTTPIKTKRCDFVTVVNDSKAIIEPALGPHHHHLQYPTFSEDILTPGKSMRFQVSVPGTFELHDHIKDEITTTLIVAE